jgi:hypothetical protein
LSRISLATEVAVNRHCLFDAFDQALQALESGNSTIQSPGLSGFSLFTGLTPFENSIGSLLGASGSGSYEFTA